MVKIAFVVLQKITGTLLMLRRSVLVKLFPCLRPNRYTFYSRDDAREDARSSASTFNIGLRLAVFRGRH
jgi:hypothetical protein